MIFLILKNLYTCIDDGCWFRTYSHVAPQKYCNSELDSIMIIMYISNGQKFLLFENMYIDLNENVELEKARFCIQANA